MVSEFSIKNIKAIIGLGNPGSKYYKNRHNIGFRVLDKLTEHYNGQWQAGEKMEHALISIPDQGGQAHQVYLVKPQTFMNDSGKVLPWLIKKGIKPDQILVVHDELEKKFGQLVLKFGGSHKGHNGLRSIMGAIGPDFWHLRFGIGRPADQAEVPTYVLSDFTKQEEQEVPLLIEEAIALIHKN